jgi:large subunit ribosomal protein L31e
MEEKIVTVNIRKDIIKDPNWRRSDHAVSILRKSLMKKLKTDVKIDRKVNEKVWAKGIKKPETRFRLKIIKIDDKTSRAELA